MNIKDRIMEVAGGRRVLLPVRLGGPSGFISVRELRAILASDRYSLLVTGETGTGKEMMADCVFQVTKRPKAKCQKINCAGMDRNLVGSELFGHKKGAFTGADADRAGLLKACDGGVLFLDEIGWLPEDLQARLLRFMETGEIRPLGADRVEQHVDVRIVAATNKDVNDAKVLIPDLRQRFDFEVKLPALKDRPEDILWFLCEPGFLGDEDVFTGIDMSTWMAMQICQWNGNIRELKKYCQRKRLFRPLVSQSDLDEIFGEERHVLSDWSLNNTDGFISEADAFASVALEAAERRAQKDAAFLDDPEHRRVLALLVGIDATDCGAIVPISRLRAAVRMDLAGLGEFDLGFLCDLLRDEVSEVFDSVDTNAGVGPDYLSSDLGAAFVMLGRFVKVFGTLEDRFKKQFVERGGQITNVPIRPSREFINGLGFGGPDGVLFAQPDPPTGTVGIEVVLDRVGIKGRDQEICMKCHGGASNSQIAKSMGIGTTTVQERLVEMRQEHADLLPFLSKKRAGAKPKKK